MSETVDSILITCNEPGCGLTESELLAAKEMDSSSGLVEYFSSRPGLSAAIISIAAASIGLAVFILKNKNWLVLAASLRMMIFDFEYI